MNKDKHRVITVVKMLLNNKIQLVDAENPINPNIKVIKDIHNTIFSGCTCNKLIIKLTISGDDTDIKNNATQINENIKAHRLIFIFISLT